MTFEGRVQVSATRGRRTGSNPVRPLGMTQSRLRSAILAVSSGSTMP